MRILLLSRYSRQGASTRVRSLQYLPVFRSQGWEVDVSPLFSDEYLQALYAGDRVFKETAVACLRRFYALCRIGGYDLLWIEKELFPYLPAFVETVLSRFGIPYVVDYDDAVFHNYDRHGNFFVRKLLGRKIDRVMACAALVTAGNGYLAERAEAAGAKRVEIVPTVVDMQRYTVKKGADASSATVRIGWIGSPTTTRYLAALRPVAESLQKKFKVEFIAVGAAKNVIGKMPATVLPWSEESEIENLHSFDIGVMPLDDSPWAKGKCGYKLIQYMACGLPVVASPVGVNREIVEPGENGYLANSPAEWLQALEALVADRKLRLEMGRHGRKKVAEQYSLASQASRLMGLFRELAD